MIKGFAITFSKNKFFYILGHYELITFGL